jgi:hypothetical protein
MRSQIGEQTMRRATTRLAGAALAAAMTLGVAQAKDTPGLTEANFVDVGDGVTELINTSGLAFSTMVLGSAATREARPRYATFHPSRPPAQRRNFESPCPGGGSVKVTVSDADSSGHLSTDDRFVTVFQSCAIEGSVVTGRSEFIVAAHRFEGSVEITELQFRFKDLGTAELRWTGNALVMLRNDAQQGTERYVASYRDLAVMYGPRRMRWNFSLDVVRPPIGDQVASINGTMTMGDLHLRLQQDEPYAITSEGFPRAGQLTAVDDLGSRLQVEAGRRRYAYRLFRAGNRSDTPDSTSQSKLYGKR